MDIKEIFFVAIMLLSGGTVILKEVASIIPNTMIGVVKDVSATAGEYGTFICFAGVFGILLICAKYGILSKLLD